jgi:Protein of unknown function (DUF2569)
MSDLDEAQQAPTVPAGEPSPNQAGSIGGWLILVLLWLVYVPLAELPVLLSLLSRVLVAVPRLPLPIAGLASAQLIFVLALEYVVPALLLILMLRYRASFPRYYIGWTIACSVYGFVNIGLAFWIVQLASPVSAAWHPSSLVQPLLIACVGLGIWVPYMLRSKRVKNTFVN